ncbi:hypothetical protein [uncultured Acetobacteroides sp.]|uniref:hypothetical protein n=1 Tax=uncultured Acetobacteroides sp. TaxID=1760811 RepID=UPI0029F48F63|nr:hypothetical protein [uncultured Acetobacteroides sp.]
MTQRSFRGTVSQMLLSCLNISERGIENVTLLTTMRPQWADPYFPNLKIKITKAFEENIGVDILTQVKEATAVVTGTISTAHRGLMTLKVETEVGFKANTVRRDAILKNLGLNKLGMKNIKQSTYVEVLSMLRSNLTPEIKEELVAAAVNSKNIDSLLAQASVLIAATTAQDKLKISRKSTNTANLDALNDIHEEVSTICKLVSTYFVGNKEILNQFNFTKALKEQGYKPTPKKKPTPKPPTNK